jgi:predicted nucleic acid-binding protein
MKSDIPLFYWDSCVFLSYINNEPGRADTVEDAWEAVEMNKSKVITSTVAIVEVACVNQERSSKILSPEVEELIDGIWADPAIALV